LTDSMPSQELAALGYEQARDELVAAVQRLEAGGLSLEESLALWERGEALAQHCQAKLDGVRARLDTAVAAREQAVTQTGNQSAGQSGNERGQD